MRLIFSTTDYKNTNISDERGYVYYSISTPSAFKKVTTITRYRWSGANAVPETMGVIEWHRLKETMLHFDGKVTPANVMLETRTWSSGRYFVGLDRKAYKWKIESGHCWMKLAESDAELVRFHRKNLGIMKPVHPAYLEVSPKVVQMLDQIILTFIYVESLREARAAQRGARVGQSGAWATPNGAWAAQNGAWAAQMGAASSNAGSAGGSTGAGM